MPEHSSTIHQARDLVCGMDVNLATSRFNVSYAGKTYYFCSSECLELFKRRAKPYSMDFLETLPATSLMEESHFAERRIRRWTKPRSRKMYE